MKRDVLRLYVRLMFCALVFSLFISKAAALDVNTQDGYVHNSKAINTGAGLDYLADQDIIGFSVNYVDGPALYRFDANGDGVPAQPQLIFSLSSAYYGSFVKVSPDGTFAIFGVTGAENSIKRLDLNTFAVSELAAISGNFDVAFLDNNRIYISAYEGIFDPSNPSRVYYMRINDLGSLKLAAEISGTPAGAIALNSANDLFYIKSTWTFPAPPASHRLLKFAADDLETAIAENEPLGETDSQISVKLDSGYDLAINQHDSANNIVFISAFDGGIFRLDEQSLEPELFASSPAADTASYTYLALQNPTGLFTAYGPHESALGASVAANSFTEYHFVELTSIALDTDKDGALDYDEWEAGSDENDPGSLPLTLKSPVYSLWNGFLEMINILELINNGSSSITVKISLFKIDGSLGTELNLQIAAKEQFDVILNDLDGFEKDSYGLVRLEYQGSLDGRISFYRAAGNGSGFDFAFAVPLANPRYGQTAVGFNTYQPSMNLDDAGRIVANWLSVVNLSAEDRQFTVNKYDQEGSLLSLEVVVVPGFGRRDFEGGHVQPGPRHVGLLEVQPSASDTPYLAQLVRYGMNSMAGYNFAFPLATRAGNGRTMYAPISSEYKTENWLEVINTSSRSVWVLIRCFDAKGDFLRSWTLGLKKYSQQHVNTSELLDVEEKGMCSILPGSKNSIVAQSMFYARNTLDGTLLSLHGSPVREPLGEVLHGSYNLFLNMENTLRLINTRDQSISLIVRGFGQTELFSRSLEIPAYGVQDLELHDSSIFNTAADTYGVVLVEEQEAGSVIGELLRTRTDSAAALLDYRVPTPLR